MNYGTHLTLGSNNFNFEFRYCTLREDAELRVTTIPMAREDRIVTKWRKNEGVKMNELSYFVYNKKSIQSS